MCGISGHVSFGRPPDDRAVQNLVRRIRHRGPDDSGIWSAPDGACVLGHARLSIIDLSPLGHQPMVDPETGNGLVFNGEIYNFQELRAECEAAGDRFRSHSDTEVILALYRRHGIECLHKLRGMFAIALWDSGERRLFLARDRAGKKPLNYALVDGGLVFCSEIDPLSRHPGVDRTMDVEALELYLQNQYIPAPWSIYKAIRKLPPAHIAVFDTNGLRVEKYWEVDYRPKVRLSESDALEGLEEVITEAVRLRMISDVPLGALLSGGVDSSVVVAIMAGLSDQPIRTFSIGFEEEAFNELPFAQFAAERCGTNHHAEILKSEIGPLMPKLVRHYGEPFADSSAAPSFLVSEVARREVTVAMNGDGGDELLGGYPRYQLSNLQKLASRLAPGALPPETLVKLAALTVESRSLPARAVRKLVTEYGWPELRSVNMYAGFWDDRIRRRLLGAASDPDLLPRWRAQFLADAMAHADDPIDRMLWYDNHTYLPGDLLVKMDIASMHCGLETRSPLLDHKVIEYCAGLEVKFKVNNGTGKYLLKKLAEKYYPADFVHRKKMGFGIPLGEWLRGPMKPLVDEVLLDAATMEPLCPLVIREVLTAFEQGAEYSSRIWALLMFGLWRRNQTVDDE